MAKAQLKEAFSKITAAAWYEKSKTEATAAAIFGGLNLYELFTSKDPVVLTVTGISAVCFGIAAALHRERANKFMEPPHHN
jgi:hypothetical protein